jgi:hypothetical protein
VHGRRAPIASEAYDPKRSLEVRRSTANPAQRGRSRRAHSSLQCQ